MRPLLLPFLCLFLAASGSARAEEDGLTPEQRKALAEMEAKIQSLKKEGKLPTKLPDEDGPKAASGKELPPKAAPASSAQAGCVQLKAGESAVVIFERQSSPTGIPAGYGLSRVKDDVYLVELRERFERGEGYEGGLSDKEIDRVYRERVAACFKEFEGMLRNERSGKSLVIRLTDNAQLPLHTIKIVKPGLHPNEYAESHEYPSDIDCVAVLHEQLHLLGLPDEYSGKPGLTEALYDCRPSGPADSVMCNPWEAQRSTQPRTAYSVEMCRCEKKGDACWELAGKVDGKKCPPGTTSFLKAIDPDLKTSLNVMNSSEAFILNEKKIPTGAAPPAHTSALYPAHFRAITEPGCLEANGSYYGCVINSYRYSKAPLNRAPDSGQGCLPKPEACKWGSHKWLE